MSRVDGDKVKLMTRMASFEENEGREAIRICNYFRSDYVTLNVVKAIVSATISMLSSSGCIFITISTT